MLKARDGGCCVGGYAIGHGYLDSDYWDATGAGLVAMMKIMNTVGVSRWEDLKGKYIRVETEGWGGTITKIGHLIDDDWFDLQDFLRTWIMELLVFLMRGRKMKKCDECAFFRKTGKTIIRVYSDGRPEEELLADNCLLHNWLIPEDSHDACEEWITEEDLKVQIEESQLVEREEREWESWNYECHGDEKYHEELCGIRSDIKWGWI